MTDYEYDYFRYREIILALLDVAWRDPESLEIGEDISDIPSVKIIFDGYGDLEVTDEHGDYIGTDEGGNKTMESYAIFIHRDSGKDDFVFPPHTLTPWALVHRPGEEICIYAWYDTESCEWTINGLEELSEHELDDETVMTILESIHKQWFQHNDE